MAAIASTGLLPVAAGISGAGFGKGASLSLGTVLSVAGLATSAIGAFSGANAQADLGDAQLALAQQQQQAADVRALQFEQQAGQERAASQREAAAARRRKRLAQSTLQARAAASGAGALDPTVLDLEGDIEEEGEFQALSALFEGESRARDLEFGATLERHGGEGALFVGQQQAAASRRAAATTALRGIGSTASGLATLLSTSSGKTLLDKYG